MITQFRHDDNNGSPDRAATLSCIKHTNESKDVADGGHKDNQQVDHKQETKCNADVHRPVERLVRVEHLQQGPADLQGEGWKRGTMS